MTAVEESWKNDMGEEWKNDMGGVQCKKGVGGVAAPLYKINCTRGMLREWGEHGLNWGISVGGDSKGEEGGDLKEREKKEGDSKKKGGFKGEGGDSNKENDGIQRRMMGFKGK